jgi:hypothetical protein
MMILYSRPHLFILEQWLVLEDHSWTRQSAPIMNPSAELKGADSIKTEVPLAIETEMDV